MARESSANAFADLGHSRQAEALAKTGCPVELSLAVLGGKWKTVVLAHLKQGPLRYGDLRARIPSLADKVLSERLRDLQTGGCRVARQAAEALRQRTS